MSKKDQISPKKPHQTSSNLKFANFIKSSNQYDNERNESHRIQNNQD